MPITTLFPSLGHLFFLLSLLSWGIFEFSLLLAYNRAVNEGAEEKFSKFVLITFNTAGFWGGFAFLDARTAFMGPFIGLRWLGIALILLAFLGRYLIVRHLGRDFSANIGVQPDQKLRTTGYYKMIRHPSYAADIVGFLGLSVGFAHPISSCLVFFLPAIALVYRIEVEEKVLLKFFGAEYRDYRQKTKKIIPYLY